MIDRWTFIRCRARDVLDRYASKVGRSAFQAEGGSHRVLKEIAEFGFDEFYLDMEDDMLPINIDGQLSTIERSISIRAQAESIRKPLIAAHEMGHLALRHPARDFQCARSTDSHISMDADGAQTDPQDGTIPVDGTINDEAHHIDEQPHVGALSQIDKMPRAYRPRDRWELEANVFAAELLAPLDEVRRYIHIHRDWQIKEIADYFGLSKDAMRNQLVSACIACPRPDFTDDSAEPKPEPVELLNYLDLDPEQERAARASAPALIIAGPGAGKTRVLTARFARLVNEDNVKPSRILALTFSNKAVAEMRQRLYEAFPGKEHEIQVFTFHALGLELLCGYGGYVEPPIVLSDADIFVFLRSRLHQLPLGGFRNLTNPTLYLDEIHKRINRLKEGGITPQEFERRVLNWQAELTQQPRPVEESSQEQFEKQGVIAARCLDLAAIYATYQRWLEEEGYIDYPDLINRTLQLFEDEKIAQSICANYDHILVDEFQDINLACGQLVKALNENKDKVWAVADPRQSIYGFRGSSLRHLARFKEDYLTAEIITLETNYRSLDEIVAASDAVPFPEVAGSSIFNVPKLKSGRGPSSQAPAVHVGQVPPQSKKYIATAIENAEIVANIKQVSSTVPPERIAVLCRYGYQARNICEALESAGIPTNWSGQPEEQEAFKDLMAVLLLADNRPLSLLRLTKKSEHFLSESDLQLILREAAQQENKLHRALDAARKGQIAGLSPEGQAMAASLRKLSGRLKVCPNAWHALAVYLFEETEWIRYLLEDGTPQARRYLATMCQVLDLSREFAFKGKISLQADTRAFLDYVSSAREAGSLPCPDSTPIIADAVNILTIHKSKGLEWSAVFVPDWDFTPYTRADAVPLPSNLLYEDDESIVDEEDFGRSCLAYVAITRAEDQLWISHSVPAPAFLSELICAVDIETRMITRPPLKRIYPPVVRLPFAENVIPYSMIRQYGYCPKRAQYDYVYNLRTESSGYLFFVRRVRQILAWLVEQQAVGISTSPEKIISYIDSLWDQDKKPERRLSPFYKDQALRCAHAFAARLQPYVAVELLKEWEWPLALSGTHAGVAISFKTDEFVQGELQNADVPLARLHRYDSPSDKHITDPILGLYQLIDQGNDGLPVEVRLHYLADGREETIIVDSENDSFSEEREIMKTRAREIKRGYFPARPAQKDFCRRCPYNLICPT